MRRILVVTTLVTAVGLLASTQTSRKTPAQTSQEISPAKSKGYVLQPDEGEKLADPRGGIIKVSPQAGSQRLSMVVQPLTAGNRIGVHMHERDEEVFFVHKGKGTVILDEHKNSGSASVCDKTRETCLPISETFFELFAQTDD